MKKPVIKWSGRLNLWVCKGCKIKEYGDTPSRAYVLWRVRRDKANYYANHSRQMETGIYKFDRSKAYKDLYRRPTEIRIAQIPKSNAVPVFNAQQAKDTVKVK